MNQFAGHPDPEALTLLALGDLDPVEAAAVEAHLGGCAACKREHAVTAATLGRLRADGDAPVHALRLDVARLAAQDAMGGRGRMLMRWVPAGAAAAAALVVGASVALRGGTEVAGPTHGRQPTPPASVRHPVPTSATATVPASAPVTAPSVPTPAGPAAPATVPSGPATDRGPEGPVGPPPDLGDEGRDPPAPAPPSTVVTPPPTGTDPAPPQTSGPEPEARPTPDAGPSPVAPPSGPTVTAPAIPPGLYLSAMVSSSASIVRADGTEEALEKGAGVPWDADVRLDPHRDAPAVVVLNDGAVLSIEGGPALLRVRPAAAGGAIGLGGGRPGGDERHEDGEKGAWRPAEGPEIALTPRGARVVYVAVPHHQVQRVQLGGVRVVVEGGGEALLTFNAAGEPEGLAVLSPERAILYTVGGAAPRECPGDHYVALREADAKPHAGAQKAAGGALNRVRLLHGREGLRLVAVAAGKVGPAAGRVTEQFSRLSPHTLRLNAPGLVRLLDAAAEQEVAPGDMVAVAQALVTVDREELGVRECLWMLAGWKKSGAELEDGLKELLQKLRNKKREAGKRGGDEKKSGAEEPPKKPKK